MIMDRCLAYKGVSTFEEVGGNCGGGFGGGSGLSAGAVIAIVVSISAFLTVVGVIAWYRIRYNQSNGQPPMRCPLWCPNFLFPKAKPRTEVTGTYVPPEFYLDS
jgi:hypothetical protein